jgi:N-acetylneuraminate synthase
MDSFELKNLLKDSQEVFVALGGAKEPSVEEEVTMAFAFASVVANRDIQIGETFSLGNLWVKRPRGGDFGPEDLTGLIGKKAKEFIPGNTQLRFDQVSK